MSTLHYFQRYSQKENWLTNNTLLLLKHLNHYEHAKFQKFVERLDEQSEIHIGPTFRQQTRVENSVPDGAIVQESFKILVEAKPHGNLNVGQLKGHAEGFEEGNKNILLVLTKNPVDEKERIKHKEDVTKSTQVGNIAVVFRTYEELYNSVMEVLDDQDKELIELAEDYAAMCMEENLFEVKPHTMMAVSCSNSYEENKKYSIYYDPIDRNHNLPFAYMGFYYYKQIGHVGKVEKVVACDLIDNELVCTREEWYKDFDGLTEDEIKRIKAIINETEVYNLKKGKKFFILSNLTEMEFKKSDSSGAIQSKRYFNLKEYEGFKKNMSANELAKVLDGHEW